MLSSYLVQPRQGHLEAVYCIYGYLKAHHRSTMVFEDGYLNWREQDFPQYDWVDFYPDATEEHPPNAPTPCLYKSMSSWMQTMQVIKLLEGHKRESSFI